MALIATISVCILIFTGPAVCIQMANAFSPHLFDAKSYVPAIIATMAMLNSLMNIIIYVIKDAGFRERSKTILRCRSSSVNVIV